MGALCPWKQWLLKYDLHKLETEETALLKSEYESEDCVLVYKVYIVLCTHTHTHTPHAHIHAYKHRHPWRTCSSSRSVFWRDSQAQWRYTQETAVRHRGAAAGPFPAPDIFTITPELLENTKDDVHFSTLSPVALENVLQSVSPKLTLNLVSDPASPQWP